MKSRAAEMVQPQEAAPAGLGGQFQESWEQQEGLTGTVKSWNGGKGYGFITCEQITGDIFFSRNELPEEAREVRGTFLEGRTVTFEAQEGTDGRAKASKVFIIAMDGQPLAGIIKSYSEQNRYGFVTSSSLTDDVRFQNNDLPPMTAGPNLKGKLVTFEMQQLPDGKLRVTKMQFQSARMAGQPNFFGGYAGAPPAAAHANAWGHGRGGPAQGLGQAMLALPGPRLGGGSIITGVVKSFSDRNGYGFINTPGQMQDIKFGKVDLAVGSIAAGAAVTFVPAVAPDGRIQARQVQPASMKRPGSFASPAGTGPASRPMKQQRTGSWVAPTQTQPEGAPGQPQSGTVKSYIPTKGFGFITSPDHPGDIYFMRQMLPPEVQGAELKGQSVTFELAYLPDGKLRATSVSPA